MLRADHVAIVGGGFSGTLLAINLLRYGSLKVTLIEQRPDHLARGIAFGGAPADHILNVRAANMSAFPDQPAHFVDWLKHRDIGADATFATRQTFGTYLRSLLEEAQRDAGDRLAIMLDRAVDLALMATGCVLTLETGRQVPADMVALATGNLAPRTPSLFRGLPPSLYIGDPWKAVANISAGLRADDNVLLLGTGLTAVDCAQTLDAHGFRGRVIALSRRGLLPRRHAMATPFTPRTDRPTGSNASLVGEVRDRADTIGWRNAIDEIRPFTQDMWRAASPAARSRFLRHLRPFWDVHRHRIAPRVAELLDRMMREGRLQAHAGKLLRISTNDSGLHIEWRQRGTSIERQLQVVRIINCTGPLLDLTQTTERLLRSLVDQGLIRPDPHEIGIDVDRQNRALDRDGRALDRIMVIGPMTRGAHWEIVAVPDIRRQTWALARNLTGAHWVEAEGL